jgi:type IV secretory pathway VirB10-like protein
VAIKREVIGQEQPRREKSTALRPVMIVVLALAAVMFFVWLSSGAQAVQPARPPELQPEISLTGAQRSAAEVVEVGSRRAEARAKEEVSAAPVMQPTEGVPPMVSALGADPAAEGTQGGGADDWTPRAVEGESYPVSEPGGPGARLTPAEQRARQEAQLQAMVEQHVQRVMEAKLQRREAELAKQSLDQGGGGGGDAPRASEDDSRDESEDSQMGELRKMQTSLLRQSAEASSARSAGGLGHLRDLAELGGAGGVLGASGGSGEEERRHADPKLDFFMRGGDQLRPSRLEASVQPPPSKYMLRMGSIIPCALMTAIHSESPGQITGMVTENVFDDISQRHLLIPMGTKMVGTYSGAISMGDERVQAAAVRLNFRDGSTLDLGGMMIADSEGRAGLHDKVNRHLWQRLVAFALNTSAAIGAEATRPVGGFGIEGALHRGISESVLQTANQMTQQASQMPPTLEIRQGARCTIAVSKDIVFPKPYEDGITQRRSRRGPSGRGRNARASR